MNLPLDIYEVEQICANISKDGLFWIKIEWFLGKIHLQALKEPSTYQVILPKENSRIVHAW